MLRWTRAWALVWASLACAGGACTLSVDGTAPTSARGVGAGAGAATGDGAGGRGGATTTSGAGGASSSGGSHAGGATTTAPTGGAGGATCKPDEKRCDGACVPAIGADHGCDPTTCVPCHMSGNEKMTCDFGVCAVETCEESWADCNGDAADGCEVSLASEHSCGGCDVSCPAGADCVDFVCTCTGSGAGLCGGVCTSLMDDEDHCGDCDTQCAAGTTCEAGKCVCPGKLVYCDGKCVDTMTDPQNCGACGAPAVCGCGTKCCCDGKAVDTCDSDKNCGACGHDCPPDKKCDTGVCVHKGQ